MQKPEYVLAFLKVPYHGCVRIRILQNPVKMNHKVVFFSFLYYGNTRIERQNLVLIIKSPIVGNRVQGCRGLWNMLYFP